ncbi:SpaA isopeptide-forming pilin-related protein [Bacillus cereus]|uniref:SpaA isopeptide-forming pilin-related protein n=1 Tax=Bacillus cereus TaxID=1396 RepID=A0AAW5L5W8_BACCE|nr:SpaA isopeptide-forming pilin-related protein [Bacillus cereus]MCQ6288677.1 SpaA isopeptide-forming pilin-related protein [Bacillus cereus]MCQ6317993.1 SpaA isopeptide-forming pilin-related protein [Bacillus cereus]MCQ6329203.1 SpaA isopeptide-forming pilin-related protein [Bacillus cereus]MCQ6385816.1 SpaA isopeptide-forming pilin-related protein [Bacillus cereus]
MILKRSYQALLLVMSIFLLLMSFFIPLNKASAEVINHEKYEMKWAYSPQFGKDIRTELLKNSKGQVAYCLVYGLKSPNGSDLPESGRTNDIVYRVLLNGYPQKSPEELGVSTWEQAHYSTQLALWNSLGQINTAELQFKDAAVEKSTKAIIHAADQSQDTQDVYMNVVPTGKKEAQLNGEYFETTTYAVQTNAKKGTFKVQMNNAPQGTRVVTEQGEAKEMFQIGEKFRIQVPKSSKSNELSLKVVSNLTNYNAIAYKGTETIQDATVLLERSTEQVSTDLQVYWKANGSIKVMKVDENKKPLPGAVFEVLNSNQEVMGTITADKNGVAELGNLELGTYTIKEVKAPVGYVLDSTPKSFEVKTGEVAVVEMKNEQIKGNVQLLKVDQDGKKKLEGAVFILADAKGNSIHEYATDKDGLIKVDNLKYGEYQFIEKSSPAGYILVKEPIPFSIKENGKKIELIAKNTLAKGTIEITKVDVADGNNKLPGAEFTIYDEQGKEVVKGKTNEQGIAKFEKLPVGKYTYKETLAPQGYVINQETFSFEIKQDGEIIKHIVKDKKIEGILEITKVDVADGNNKLPEAEFTIYDDQGKEVVKGKTNEQGIAKFEKLPAGKYTYKETLAPNGYLINEETFHFEIKNDGEIIKHTVQDKKKEAPPTPVTPQPEQPKIPQLETPQPPQEIEKPVPIEKPLQIVKQPEQPKEQLKKVESHLPTTGGKAENPYWYWVGATCVALGGIAAVHAYRKRKKESLE